MNVELINRIEKIKDKDLLEQVKDYIYNINHTTTKREANYLEEDLVDLLDEYDNEKAEEDGGEYEDIMNKEK